MAIAESDIKRLWGKAAGRCSYPSCGVDCLPFLDLSDPTVIGEMAHVIARSTRGPRGKRVAGSNSYSNLILLCPTHHTLTDKAPTSKFPAKTLLQWKANHEARVESSLRSPLFPDRPSLAAFVRTRLTENRVCWQTYGPESEAAKKNPLSTAAYLWPFRKLAIIVPNNQRIVCAIHTNAELFASDEYEIACRFVEHAEGFERNCTHPTENVPRFPTQFAEMFGE
jgi:hypothetical protein